MATFNINVDASSKQTRTDLLGDHDGRGMDNHKFPVYDPGAGTHEKYTGAQLKAYIRNSFGINDAVAGHILYLLNNEVLTADRTLKIVVQDADRTITIDGDALVRGINTGDQDLSPYATIVYADSVGAAAIAAAATDATAKADAAEADAIAAAAADAQSKADAAEADAIAAAAADATAKANAAEANANAYADSLVVSVFRPAGSWDASAGTWPTSGTGAGGGIRRGDTYNVTVAGTLGGTFYDIGDNFYANQATPGQVNANWSRFEANTSQSTEAARGTAALATQAEIEDNVTPNDIDIVTPKKWWQGWTKGLTLSGFASAVRGVLLTGLDLTIGTAVVAGDSILAALGKLQKQITDLTAVVSGKEGSIAAGSTSQYWRGDKSWQTLDKGAVGLSNVDNTSDANKPVSTAQATAIAAKANACVVNIYTGAGSYTWNKGSGAKSVYVHLLAGGGGGSSGRKSAAGVGASGGAGGGAGAESFAWFDASVIGASETVVVGAGGPGGASQTANSGNGLVGTAGGQSNFGAHIRASGGSPGGAASPASATAGAGGAVGRVAAQSGGAGSTGVGVSPSTNVFAFTGGAGGSGGGITAGNAASNGGNGGNGSLFKTSSNPGGTGGVVDTTAPTSPTAGTANKIDGGGGGAGGASSVTTNAQAGTNGALYGAGGGGGGAARDGVGNSGAGGNGSDGIVMVITYF